MIDQITNDIKSKPYLIQIAKDDVWEKTWDIDPSKDLPDAQAIDDYLAQSPFEFVSIEAVFNEGNDKQYIFGIDDMEGLKTSTPKQFIQVFIDAVAKYEDFAGFIRTLNRQLIDDQSFLIGDADLIRIGIVNHWFSIGPCVVWEKGWPKTITTKILEERLDKKPDVKETNLNYQGMSFLFHKDTATMVPAHWIKSPCSKKENDVWKLDTQIILQYLHAWQNFTIEE